MEDRGEPAPVAEGAERGDGGFTYERVVVVGCRPRELADDATRTVRTFTERERGSFGDETVGVGEKTEQRTDRNVAAEARREVGRPAPHRHVRVGRGREERVARDRAPSRPHQRPQRRAASPWVGTVHHDAGELDRLVVGDPAREAAGGDRGGPLGGVGPRHRRGTLTVARRTGSGDPPGRRPGRS